MTQATPLYNLRYPEKTDPRISPLDIQHLAEDAEAMSVQRGFSDGFPLYKKLREARRAALGTATNYLISWPFNPSVIDPANSVALINSRMILVPQLVPAGDPVDGVAFLVQQQGNFNTVGTKENRVGAYTFDGTTFTRVAASSHNPSLWQQANGFRVEAFSAQLAAASVDRLLWAAAVYNNNGTQTTPPQIFSLQVGGGNTAVPNAKILGLTTFGLQVDHPTVTGVMPATFGAGALDLTFTNRYWLAFYRNYA